jgi:tetratricopeptide (TPR) repeat protein
MKLIPLSGRRGAAALCILLSACAAGPLNPLNSLGGAGKPGPAYGAYLAARYADDTGDPAQAAKYYRIALHAAPDNQELIAEGFMAGVLSGDASATTLATRQPHNVLATMLLGNHAAMTGDFVTAQADFTALPQDDLTGLIQPLLIAWTQYGQGNEQAALNGLGPYFNNGNFGAVYVLNAALIADAAGDTRNAAQLYGAVDGSQPNLRMAQILASWYTRQGQPGQAMAELSALIAVHPDLAIAVPAMEMQLGKPVISSATDGMAEAYLTLAGSLTQPQAALLRIAFLRFALGLRPDLTAARLLLADTQTGADNTSTPPTPVQLQNALDTLAPVRKSDPLYAPAALQQATLLAALNRTDEAVALLTGLLVNAPHDPTLLSTIADTLRQGSQYAAAIPYYTQAIAALTAPAGSSPVAPAGSAPAAPAGSAPAGPNLPPSAWTLYFDRGICEDQLGRWDQALPDMQMALKLSPSQPYVLNYMAYSWAVHGQNLAEAKTMLAKAVALDPNDGAVIDSLGYVEMKLGDTQQAITLLTQAVQLSADDAEVNGHLGDAFWQAGRPLQADFQWQRALSLHPDAKLKAELQGKITAHFGNSAP